MLLPPSLPLPFLRCLFDAFAPRLRPPPPPPSAAAFSMLLPPSLSSLPPLPPAAALPLLLPPPLVPPPSISPSPRFAPSRSAKALMDSSIFHPIPFSSIIRISFGFVLLVIPPFSPMSNFLRRLVRSKSRSNSPQKAISSHCQCFHPPSTAAEEAWTGTIGSAQQNCPAAMANNFSDGTATRPQLRRATDQRRQTAAEEKLYANSISCRPPPAHFDHSSPESARRCLSDEPGTSSQEFLSPTPWPNCPTPFSMRNSHSNPNSSANSKRPSIRESQRLSPLQALCQLQRPRSISPRNRPSGSKCSTADATERPNFRSQSPAKKTTAPLATKTKDYLLAQCHLEGCSAIILVEDTRFLVCKHQLSHASDFFRSLFLNTRALPLEGVRQIQADEYVIQVSSLRHPPQALQFQWFLETSVPSPTLRDVSDELLETCMRLCKRFAARGLEMRCTRFIQQNVEAKPPMMALCWLNWAFKHHFHRAVQEACLPVVARLSLQSLEKHRQMVPEMIFGDILAMKLRTTYQQASSTFHTIHRMDHFHVEMDKCPRCGRQKEQCRVRVQVSPCHKLIGCELCMRDFDCELEGASPADLRAYWQCEHGLWPFAERTECCRCQLPLYRANRIRAGDAAGTMSTEMAAQQHRPKNSYNPNPASKSGSSAGRS